MDLHPDSNIMLQSCMLKNVLSCQNLPLKFFFIMIIFLYFILFFFGHRPQKSLREGACPPPLVCATALLRAKKQIGSASTSPLNDNVSKAISELFEGQEEATQTIKIIDDGFDVLNSGRRYADESLPCALGAHQAAQGNALHQLEDLMLTARFVSRKRLLPFPFQLGLLSIRSTLVLFQDMKNVDGFEFLLAALLNQDAHKSCFSSIRNKHQTGARLNATPTEMYRLRLLPTGVSPVTSRQVIF